MKFAKYQANNLVPEWRRKYLDYKKGKKLLKEVGRNRWRRGTPSSPVTSNGQRDGHEADSEDDAHISRSSTYGSIQPNQNGNGASMARQRSRSQGRTSAPTFVNGPQPSPTSGSDDSATPIVVPLKARVRKTDTAKSFTSNHRSIRQVFDSIRRPRKYTRDVPPDSVVPESDDSDFDEAELNFLNWLDGEIKKIDDFYQEKENEAEERYKVLFAQLEQMRQLRDHYRAAESNQASHSTSLNANSDGGMTRFRSGWVNKPLDRIRASMDGLNSAMPTSDHERRSKQPELMAHPFSTTTGYVEYRVARRRLKQAMLEFYRGMELLKNYRLLNRTGLSKILKKYDKTAGRRLSAEYTEKIKGMHFDRSEDLTNIMDHTEDLFARYFERNNRKNAIERLRSRDKPNEHSGAVFNVGFLLGLAIPFFIEGLVVAFEPNTAVTLPQTSYLLQIWGGFGLVILFLLLFGINCWVWHTAKINYTFIFEFDTRHNLDYRQYLELPALLAFLGCFFFWLTFNNFWPNQLNAVWYPLVFLCIGVGVLLFPFRTLHRSSRAWFAIANFRVLFSGLYPIEFRDFFLGDQYNSLIYSIANCALFFCLYARDWNPNDLTQCNSSHSRVLGFFSTLPGIWRFLQCLRRYWDTRHPFPHLVNAGKYSATILMYTMLSLWRIDDAAKYQALFIVFAIVNSLYCSSWDLLMDWSLGQPHAPHPFLRHDLGYKRYWVYYVAMVIDPIMRFSWLFYVVFPGQKQHSAATSFFIALGEVFRRFIWNFFRVENEHMTNVGQFIAARDVPLPFSIPIPTTVENAEAQPFPTKRSLTTLTMGSVRRGMVKMTSSIRIKHAEDFGRKQLSPDRDMKGKLPEDDTSEAEAEEDEIAREEEEMEEEDRARGARMREETSNLEMRDMDDSDEESG